MVNKLRIHIERFRGRIDKGWNGLPIKKQKKYTLALFLAYAFLTILMLFDVAGSGDDLRIKHIEAPEIPKNQIPAGMQDTVSIILKNKIYERI